MNREILRGKRCLITGATGGLGRAMATELGRNGCDLFLSSTRQGKLRELRKTLSLENDGIAVYCEAGDLGNLRDLQRIIKRSRKTIGSIDILINCAGIMPVKLMVHSTLTDFESCFNVNVRAPFLLCQEFSRDMMKHRWGRIVNVASSGAYNGRAKTSIYRASKHALLGFSRSITKELRDYNVRTFCISPGPIKTRMGRAIVTKDSHDERFGTFIDPAEIAAFVAGLMSFDNEMFFDEFRLGRIVGEQ